MSELLSSGFKQKNSFVFDFWPTGSCDMECPFCYGAKVPDFINPEIGEKTNRVKYYVPSAETAQITNKENPRPEMELEQVMKILVKMNNAGGDTITVAGGEPLLRRETPEILRFAKETLGMTVYLSTDGTFVRKRYPEFSPYLDVMGLPLDGSTSEMNIEMGRKGYLLPNITGILEGFEVAQPLHRVKVGTVVSRVNLDDAVNIGRFLFRNDRLRAPDIWRIYQFEAIGRGRVSESRYKITDDEFEEVCKKLEEEFPDVNLRPRSNETHLNAYFFVTPDGILQVVDKNRHISIADLLSISDDNLQSIVNRQNETVLKANQNRAWLNSQ